MLIDKTCDGEKVKDGQITQVLTEVSTTLINNFIFREVLGLDEKQMESTESSCIIPCSAPTVSKV